MSLQSEELDGFWASARERVRELSRIDCKCDLVFASDSHQYAIENPIDEASLAILEAKLGIRLPENYRSMLVNYGSGGAGPNYGIISLQKVDFERVAFRFELEESIDCELLPEDYLDDIPPGTICISTAGCGIDSFLEVNGPNPGTIWVNAGPGDTFAKCDLFENVFEDWLKRLEYGLNSFRFIGEQIEKGLSLANLIEAMMSREGFITFGGKTHFCINRDESEYLRFYGVPGAVKYKGETLLSQENMRGVYLA